MTFIKRLILTVIPLLGISSYAQYTDVINSNRPGASRSAYTVGRNVLQFEAGPFTVNEERVPEPKTKAKGFGVDFAVRYGLLWEQLELNVEGNYQNDTFTRISSGISSEEKRSNFRTLAFGAKYLVFDPYKKSEKEKPNIYSWNANHRFMWRSVLPAVSVYLGGHLDAKDNPFTAEGIEGFSPRVIIATQNNFSNGWVFVTNFIFDRIGTEQSDFTYILTLTHGFGSKWVVFGETQGIRSNFYADNLFRVGGAYLLAKDFQLDTALTFNTKDTPTVLSVNFGMSYRLDFHKDKIKEEKIDNGNSLKKNKSKKRKKSKRGAPEPEKTKHKKSDIDF